MARANFRIAGSHVLLTGATGGLGGVIARSLDARGARLTVTGRKADALDTLASQLHTAEIIQCDLAKRAEIDKLIGQLDDVDVLIANAALPGAGTLDEFTTDDIDRALDVNLRAPILLAKHLAPRMAARGHGHLVFISSMGAKLPATRLSIYAATKYALRGFGACLRQELHGTGVGVSVLFPGSVRDVGMFAESGAHTKGGTVTSTAVADGVVRAIEGNRAEVEIAPMSIRLGGFFANLAPEAFARMARKAGADKQTAELAAGLRHKK